MINKKNKKGTIGLVWHIHQPIFIPDEEVLRQINESYLLILKIHNDLNIPLTLNITGALLKRFIDLSPEIVDLILKLLKKDLLELTGSGYYHPMIPMLTKDYAGLQVNMDLEIKTKVLGVQPNGFWPTDLGWSPWMVKLLSERNLSWVIIDSFSLMQSNSLPQWNHVKKYDHKVLEPHLESVFLQEEQHRPYLMSLGDSSIKVFIRDRKFSLELSDFESSVFYNPQNLKLLTNRIKESAQSGQYVLIGEDGERVNAQTARVYRLFLLDLLEEKSLNFQTPSKYLEDSESVLDEKYFPASTFQLDLKPWESSMDDQSYIFYMNDLINKVANLELLINDFKNSREVKEKIKKIKSWLLKAQDSGCIFWKFHNRTRKPGWQYLFSAEKIIEELQELV